MKLTPNFTLDELTVSDFAARKGLSNYPTPEIIEHLRLVAVAMEQVRNVLGGHPIYIKSGYRSPVVNKAVGGSLTSAHMQGLACDFICPAFGPPLAVARAIQAAGIEYDQLILEYGWVHLGLSLGPNGPRHMALTKRSASAPYERGINT